MNIRSEIDRFSAEDDRPMLRWLFDRYHWESQWRFVASHSSQRYGIRSYEVHHVWAPTIEGRLLYNHRDEMS